MAAPAGRQRTGPRLRPAVRQPREGNLRTARGRHRNRPRRRPNRATPRSIGRDRALEAILSSADYDADPAERWGWVTRTLPDAELDAFVDATVARLASFDRQALATAKSMVNRATLPPDADLVAAYGQFADSLTHPGFLARAAGLGALAADKGIDVEYQLGEYIGLANQTPDPLPAGHLCCGARQRPQQRTSLPAAVTG